MEQPNEERRAFVPLQILMDVKTRQVEVQGPLQDKGMCFFMLIEAIALVHQHRPSPTQIVPASANDLPPSPILQP